MTASDRTGLVGAAAARVLGLVALLFLAGLGVGAMVTTLGDRSEKGGVAGDSGGALLASSSVSVADRFRQEAIPAPARASQPRVGGSRFTPTVRAARDVGPSVVSIRTRRTVRGPVSRLDQLFGRSRSRVTAGLGSGFAIDAEGHVLTNHHVIRDAEQIEVVDRSGRILTAELVGSDEITDLAVIRVTPGAIPPAPLGTSSDLVVGEPAIAIGNPSGYRLANTEPTVTTGVVSGIGRDIVSQGEEVLYADMIQTDAAINPGNSGGPLVNAEGRVIGVNSSIFSRSGGSEGLGFAIPIDRALRIAGEIIEVGRVRRPWVGLSVVSEPSDEYVRVPLVEQVYADTPGERAGLRAGDIIVRLNGQPIQSHLDWSVALVDVGVNHVAEVEYLRDGTLFSTPLELEEIPSARAERAEVLTGLQLISVTEQIQQERGLFIEFGALIVEINETVARQTHLRQGDVIYGINGNEVRSVEEAAELFTYYAREARTNGVVRVYVVRGNRRGAFDFRVG